MRGGDERTGSAMYSRMGRQDDASDPTAAYYFLTTREPDNKAIDSPPDHGRHAAGCKIAAPNSKRLQTGL